MSGFNLQDELENYLEGGCTDERKKKCKASNGAYLDAVCAQCEFRDYEPHPYVIALFDMVLLLEAGFPVTGDEFDLDFWFDLGRARHLYKQRTSPW